MARINKDLIDTLKVIEREKGISQEDLVNLIATALQAAYKKYIGNKNADVTVKIDQETGDIRIFLIKTIVNYINNPSVEISEPEAARLVSAPKVGENITVEVSLDDFGRIAAYTTKQIILQKIKEKEKEKDFAEMTQKKGDLITGSVQRFSEDNAIIDIGKLEGILTFKEMVRTEKLGIGDRVKCVILNVTRTPRGSNVLLSRRDNLFIRKLFEQEVPEILDKTIEIKDIIREPGYRTKVAVTTDKKNIDPVGTCVGLKGMRIKAILEELRGEKIDLVLFSDNITEFIKNSLSPAKVSKVSLDRDKMVANVIVSKDQLSIAIGSHGQNVRLASKLTGWHIELATEEELKKKKDDEEAREKSGKAEKAAAAGPALKKEDAPPEKEAEAEIEAAAVAETGALSIEGISEKVMSAIIGAGYDTLEKIKNLTREDLEKIDGIGKKKSEQIMNIISGLR